VTGQERQDKLERLARCIELGEDSYAQLYEPRTHTNPAGHYSDAKDYFGEAIGLAGELGLIDQAQTKARKSAVRCGERSISPFAILPNCYSLPKQKWVTEVVFRVQPILV